MLVARFAHMRLAQTLPMAARLAREAGWAPLAVFIGYALFAPKGVHDRFDWAFHFLGGASAAYFFYRARDTLEVVLGRLGHTTRLMHAFGLACAIAVLWEIGEFVIDEWLGTRLQHSLPETMVDLILDVLGALAALGVLHLAWRKRERRW